MFKNTFCVSIILFGLFFFSQADKVFADAASELEQADAYYKNKDYSQAEVIYQSIWVYRKLSTILHINAATAACIWLSK